MKIKKSTEHMISRFSILVILTVMLIVMIPYGVFAASTVTVGMQTNDNSGAHPDAIYNFSISFTEQLTSVNVELVFNDNNKIDTRPRTVTVALARNGADADSKEVTVNTAGVSKFYVSFENLPVSDSNGKTYNYTISCTALDGYTQTIDGYRVTYTINGSTPPPISTGVFTTEKEAAAGIFPLANTQRNYNLPDSIYNAAKASNGTFTKAGEGTYTFSLRLWETLAIPDMPNLVSYTVAFTGAALNGGSYSIKPESFYVDGAVGQSTGGTAAGKSSTVFNYSPSLLKLTLHHRDIETEQPVFQTEYIRFDARGNLSVDAKTTIKDYKPVGVTNRSYNGETENKEYTFYYQSTNVEVDKIKISGQVFWEDNDITMRPKTVEIKLLCDNEVIKVKTIAVNEENSQPFSFGDFPIMDKDKKNHVYTVTQVPSVIDGYKNPSYEGDAKVGFVIVNILGTSDASAGNLLSTNPRNTESPPEEPPPGGLTNGDNSSLFNMGTALAGFIAMLVIGIIGIVERAKRKRNPDQKKPQRSAALRIMSMLLGLLLFVFALVLENITLPPAGFNANSIYFIPLSILMLISVGSFAFSKKSARRLKSRKALHEEVVLQAVNDLQHKDDASSVLGNENDISLNEPSQQYEPVLPEEPQQQYEPAMREEQQRQYEPVLREEPQQQYKPVLPEDIIRPTASAVSAPLEPSAENLSDGYAFKAETGELSKEDVVVSEPSEQFTKSAIKNLLIDEILTGLHGAHVAAAAQRPAHPIVVEPQPAPKSLDVYEYEKPVSAPQNERRYIENNTQVVIDDGWFGG